MSGAQAKDADLATSPRWSAHFVWFVASGGLLAACVILSAGSCFSGSYRQERYLRTRLRDLEEKLARKLPKAREAVVAPTGQTVKLEGVPARIAPPKVYYHTEWLDKNADDELITLCLRPGVLSESDLENLTSKLAESVSALRRLGHVRASLGRAEDDVKDLEKLITSREESTRNYENRLLRLEQQTHAVQIQILLYYSRAIAQLEDGYYTAKKAYEISQPNSNATATMAAGG